MKKMFMKANTIVFVLGFVSCFAQQNIKTKDIIKSFNIKEIEQFIATAHPDDPRTPILKKRRIQLKNEEWVKGRATAKPMAARTSQEVVEKPIIIDSTAIYEQEFITLRTKEKSEHKESTVSLLNTLFDNQKKSPDVAILIKNNSKCNIIVNLQGDQNYSVAIPKEDNNTLVVKKGNYTFTSQICDTKYNSLKTIQKSTLITLNEAQYKK